MTSRKKSIGVILLLGVFLLVNGGCAAMQQPMSDEEMQEELNQKEEKVEELESQVQELENAKERAGQLEEENEQLQGRLNSIEDADARQDGNNVVVTLDTEILFEFAEHKLQDDAKETLNDVADVMLEYSNREIVVEGHSDSVPVAYNHQFPSNWHLSAARAVSVVEYITEEYQQLEPEQFFPGGYGEYRPVAPNNSPENRAKNRRVEITFRPSGMQERVIQP